MAIRLLRADDGATNDSPVISTKLIAPNRSKANGFRGIALQLHSGRADIPFETYVEEISRTGANTISLVVAGYQENGSSSSIFIDLRKTPDDARLRKIIAQARNLGLRVVLMPIVLLENAREGEWRGKIAPENWDRWWEDYAGFLFHYAEIANETGVEVFVIGSELVTTEKFADRWREIIRKVRQRYHGPLCYSANWDHYRPIEWWDDLDIVGMTTYYDLTGGDKPTVERLRKSWQPLREEILKWQEGIGRPILFTEVGWPNQVTCAQYPWDYYRSTDNPDPTAQANCFEAFFATWIDQPDVAGFLVWEWRNYPGQEIAPGKDTSYVPTGKPAMEVIQKYFQMPDTQLAKDAATTPAVASDGHAE